MSSKTVFKDPCHPSVTFSVGRAKCDSVKGTWFKHKGVREERIEFKEGFSKGQ